MPRDRRAVIGTAILNEPSIRALTRNQQQAYLTAYLQPVLSRCGVIAYKPKAWAGLALDATEDALRNDFEALHNSRHIVIDEADESLLIRTYVRHDGLLAQPLVVAAMIRDFYNLTSQPIRIAFLTEMRRLSHIPIDDSYRVGIALMLGADPTAHGVKNANQVTKAIGTGLAEPMVDTIRNGQIKPYQADHLPKGLPEGLLKGLTEGQPKGLPDPPVDPRENARISTPVSTPVPVPVSTPPPAPTHNGNSRTPHIDDNPTDQLLTEHVDSYRQPIPLSAIGDWRNAITQLVTENITPRQIRAGLTRCRDRKLGPKLLSQAVAETTDSSNSDYNPTDLTKLTEGQRLNLGMYGTTTPDIGIPHA